jgi:glycosyltransferase involved in cell wall biosynthesis
MENIIGKNKLSVLIPSYNNSLTIAETIKSILNQSYTDFELIICDDKSTDDTINVVKSINDGRISLYVNEKNLRCGGNLGKCMDVAKGDILVYVCGDDILDIDALKKIYEVFQLSDDIGIVVRPYYWFEENYKKPVRATKQFDKTEIVSIDSSWDKIRDVIFLSDNPSGIGFRKKFMSESFDNEPFVEMASMVANMVKKYQTVILNDNIVAVRINASGSTKRSTYLKSPMMAWYKLINRVFIEEKYKLLRKYLISNFIANNYIGLVQIKNYGGYRFLMREIWYLLKMRWQNIYSPGFWFFSIGTIVTPKIILRKSVAIYKNKINSRLLKVESVRSI